MDKIKSNDSVERKNVRWDYIDLLEFIGLLCVIIVHATTYSWHWLNDNRAVIYIRYFLRTFLSASVPLFFFSNGYLLLNKKFNLKKHIFKTVNIVVLTFVWGFIDTVFHMRIERLPLSPGEIFQNLWTWHRGWSDYLWYMGALTVIYIFVPLIKNAYDNNRNIFVYFFVICTILTFGNRMLGICATVFASAVENRPVSFLRYNFFNMFNPFSELYFGYAFTYFCAGGLAHEAKKKLEQIEPKKRNIYSLIALFIGCSGLFVTGVLLTRTAWEAWEVWEVIWEGSDTIFTFINVCALFTLSLSYHPDQENVLHKLILNTSKNTLGIYFLHTNLIHLTQSKVCGWPLMQSFSGTVVYAVGILLLCLFITNVLRKIPVVRKLVEFV